MSISFNLIDEAWIPCAMLDGEISDLGLYDTLARAHEIREIVDASPLVTVSLHRLLLAILHRVFGPSDAANWAELWRAGSFDEERLGEYLNEWRHRFDLFDPQRPFYQTPGMPEKMLKSISKLATELAAGNNETLFDHTLDTMVTAMTPARAARVIVAAHNFAASGTHSGEHGNLKASASPLRGGIAFLFRGDSAFETLMLNLVAYDPHNQQPPGIVGVGDDLPAWEQETSPSPENVYPRGYLDYLTWQSRRIWMPPPSDRQTQLVVCQAALSKGREFPDDCYPRDPMMVHRKSSRGTDHPWPPLKFTEGKALWRDSMSLLQSVPGQVTRPWVVEWVASLDAVGALEGASRFGLSAFGLTSQMGKAAKTTLWRHERMPLPLHYLRDSELVGDLAKALDMAEATRAALRKHLWQLAAIVLAPDEEQKPDPDLVSKMVEGFPAMSLYWSELDTHFHRLVLDLPGDLKHRTGVLAWWSNECVAQTAMDAFARTVRGLPQTPRFLRAIVRTEGRLRGMIYGHIIKPYREVNYAKTV